MDNDDLQGIGSVSTESMMKVEVKPKSSKMADAEQNVLYEYDFLRDKKKQEIGWIGKIVGDKDEKAGNLASLLILLCIIGLGIVYYKPSGNSGNIAPKDILNFFTNIITLALGYVFGQNNGKN